jgi:hypothetical protein
MSAVMAPSLGVSLARRITLLLLLATALLGFAHAALLPPWEGFDETAHWSYIQQLNDTGHGPVYGRDGLSDDFAAYSGPMPYGYTPPFEKTGSATYRSWREAGAPRLIGGPTRYRSSAETNWQAQHPPLYYLAMVPAYRLTHTMGWRDNFLALRLASFALAWLGLALGVIGTVRLMGERTGPWLGPIMAAWPFLFPQFFPEFARLGNDSLCLLLVSASWLLTVRLLAGQGRWVSALGLGAVLGLGLLTKAFFLPIGAGVGLILLIRWALKDRSAAFLGQVVAAGALALAIGGWWYVGKALQTGSAIGSDEFVRLGQAGGLGELARGFSATELARGAGVLVGSFVWAGSFSSARLPEILLLPLVALLAVVAFDYLRSLPRGDLIAWTPVAMTAPVLAGLVYHVFVWMAGTGATTPGWYIHILAAPVGFAVALGWTRPRLLTALTAMTALYTAAAWAFQLSMFSGCAAKLGADKHYSLAGAGCFLDLHALAGVSHAGIGLFALLAGGLTALGAAATALTAFRMSGVDQDWAVI